MCENDEASIIPLTSCLRVAESRHGRAAGGGGATRGAVEMKPVADGKAAGFVRSSQASKTRPRCEVSGGSHCSLVQWSTLSRTMSTMPGLLNRPRRRLPTWNAAPAKKYFREVNSRSTGSSVPAPRGSYRPDCPSPAPSRSGRWNKRAGTACDWPVPSPGSFFRPVVFHQYCDLGSFSGSTPGLRWHRLRA